MYCNCTAVVCPGTPKMAISPGLSGGETSVVGPFGCPLGAVAQTRGGQLHSTGRGVGWVGARISPVTIFDPSWAASDGTSVDTGIR